MANENPSPVEVEKWHRWFACECNNRAWEIAENTERTGADVEEMIDAAHAAALHWAAIGTELNKARADMLLGRVHAIGGNATLALMYAERCYDFFAMRVSEDWDFAFANAVLAGAARVAGETGIYERHLAKAREIRDAMPDCEEKVIFERTFQQIV